MVTQLVREIPLVEIFQAREIIALPRANLHPRRVKDPIYGDSHSNPS
eukprot:SAG25_NODE_114_length_14860_cov_13.403672_15_plen_47_part_00